MPVRQPGTLEGLALGIGRFFAPLEQDLAGGKARVLLANLGLVLPPSADGVAAFASSLQRVVTAVGQLPGLVGRLVEELEGDDYARVAATGHDIIQASTNVIGGIADTAAAIRTLGGATGIPPATLNAFADDLPRRLVEYLIARNVEAVTVVPEVLEFAGVLERTVQQVEGAPSDEDEYTLYRLHTDRAVAIVESPLERLRAMYDWGDPGFDGSALLPVLRTLLSKAGFPAIVDDSVSPPVLDVVFAEVRAKTDVAPPGIEIVLSEEIDIEHAVPFNEGGDWQVEALTSGNLAASTSIVLQPDGTLRLTPPSAMATGEYGMRFTAAMADGTAFVIFGSPEASRLEVGAFVLEAKAGLNFDSGASAVDTDLFVGGELRDGKLVIDAGGADGFIADILAGVRVESDFGAGFGFSSDEGLFFTGSATLEIQLPAHVDLGPVRIDALTLGVGLEGGSFPVALSANVRAQLGPITAVVEEIGVAGRLTIPPDRDQGNLGPLDFQLGFKPPNGVGLALDAGVVKGGGYLYFDFDREEYAGALELVFAEWIAIRAIGLITTRMPDGSKGFSLLIVLTVEFGSGIQLGFGFTLLGVGGIVGVHRIVNVEPLKDGIRTGAIESVMFPQDVIANAPRIISDLRRFFPPQEGTFLLGPMLKLGWGTPTLLSASVGVIIEVPSVNITILGVIKVVLPDERADVLRLQVNFIGRIEPSNKLLWFYAELYDSRVLFITLEGGFGLLVKWGDPANFVVSAGGFHPRYSPPPLPFPSPPRLAVSLLNESYARIRVEAYFAVTSNSAQFGAKAELFFGLSEFRIEGHLGFDALFQFDPFFFSFGLSVSLSVKVFGIGLFSVGFSGLLEGPTPWHIEGRGSISLLFFDISVPFSHTWGGDQDTALDPITVFPLLEAELNALTNWQAQLPSASSIAVSLRKLGDSDADQLVLHPVGSLRISQRKVPINLRIAKVGNQRPSDADQFSLAADLPGAGSLSVSTLREQFATGQFLDLGDSERLSRPGFEPQDSGVEIRAAGDQLKASRAVKRVIRYESVIIDNHFKSFVRPFFHFFALGYAVLNEFVFSHFLTGNAATKSELSQHHEAAHPVRRADRGEARRVQVVHMQDNTPIDWSVSFQSQASAIQFMDDAVAADPALAGSVHVVPGSEMNVGV